LITWLVAITIGGTYKNTCPQSKAEFLARSIEMEYKPINRIGTGSYSGFNYKCKRRAMIFYKERQLWLIAIPMIIWIGIFGYYPLYGILMAFVNFIPGKEIFECKWVGLMWFKEFLTSPDFGRIIRNTLAISGLGILFGFPAPIMLAILFNEIKNRSFKKTVQTISYLPYFISWVVAASLIYSLLGSDGMVNEMLRRFGIIENSIPFLGEGKFFWGLITGANIWKGVGWSTIIYLSAIAGIDGELYQAGAVDGLGRTGMIWHIILPGIRPTIALLWILAVGQILNAGFEQQLLIGNVQTQEYWDVIDTYAYRYGVELGRYSFGTAIGLMKAIIALSLVLGTNKLSKKLLDTSII
jgi:putative aldouronate transport system permease protein